MIHRSTYEVRVNVSAMLPKDQRIAEGQFVGDLRCVKAEYYGDHMAHLEFIGEIKAYKRWAVASKMMQQLHSLIEDGTEVVFYIEEKS